MTECGVSDEELVQWLDRVSHADQEVGAPHADLALHINSCDQCQRRLDNLLDDRRLAAWRRSAAQPTQPLDAELLDRLVRLDDANGTESRFDEGEETLPNRIGEYELLHEIGRGGMGVVYRAKDGRLDRDVAIKILRLPAVNRELRTRFVREGRAMAAIDDRGVMPVFEVIDDPRHPALVMPLMEGGSLATRIRRQDYSFHDAAMWALEVAEALVTVHRQGYVHRDIKPGNVLLDRQGRIRVSDFGLVHWQQEIKITDAHVLPGTPEYVCPESLWKPGNHAGTSGDIYQCGVLLYELLVGHPPFRGPLADVLQQIATASPVAPRVRRHDVPDELQVICLKAMQAMPQDRYATAMELASDLRCFLEGRPIRARPLALTQRVHRLVRRHPKTTATVTTVAVALIVSLGVSLHQWNAAARLAAANQQLHRNSQQLGVENTRLHDEVRQASEASAESQVIVDRSQRQMIDLAFQSLAPRSVKPDEVQDVILDRLLDGMEMSLSQAIARRAPAEEVANAALGVAAMARRQADWTRVIEVTELARRRLADWQQALSSVEERARYHVVALVANRLWLEARLQSNPHAPVEQRMIEYKRLIDELPVDLNGLSRSVEMLWYAIFQIMPTDDPTSLDTAWSAWQSTVQEAQIKPVLKNPVIEASQLLLSKLDQLQDEDRAAHIREFVNP